MLKVMMMTMMMMLIKMMNNSNLFVECTLSKNIFEQQQVWFVQHTTMSSMAYCCFACNELPLFDVHVHMLLHGLTWSQPKANQNNCQMGLFKC